MDGLDALRDFRAPLGAPDDEARARVASRLERVGRSRLPVPRPPRRPERKNRSGGGFGRRGRLALLAGVAVLLIVAATVSLSVTRSGRSPQAAPQAVGQTKAERLREAALLSKSGALPGRFEALRGNGTAGADQDLSASAELYTNQAYPRNAIAQAQVVASRAANARIQPHGANKIRTVWDPVGPSTLNVDTLGTQTAGPPTQWSGRITAIAVDPRCSNKRCPIYVAAAGGGIWWANDGLSKHPSWHPRSRGLDTNAVGSITIDPSDPSGATIYVGTGESNASSDSEAGVGLYKSTNYGRQWTLLPGSVPVTKDRSISSIVVDPRDPQHLVIGVADGRHGLSSNSGGRLTPPGAPLMGVYDSHDGGATWTARLVLPQDVVNPASPTGADLHRGSVTKVQYDPNDPNTFYASVFNYGLFRTTDNGATFENIFSDSNTDVTGIRFMFDAVKLPSGKTRIYLYAGYNEQFDSSGNLVGGSSLFRIDDASVPADSLTTGGTNSGWMDLTSANPADPGFASLDICPGQCWYDMYVASPPGRPDSVVIAGSMQYGELPVYPGPDRSNGRAVQLSTDAGVSFTDMTGDARNSSAGLLTHFEDLHPDQHAIAFAPNNPDIMFFGQDGGITRTDGQYKNVSRRCNDRGLTGTDLSDCKAWLSRVPKRLVTLNAGLATLQFQSLAVNPQDPLNDALGGTQDNGTLAFSGSSTWFLPVTGDGGDSGIDAVNPQIRFHTYTGPQADVNFHGNTPASWDWFSDPMLLSGEAAGFYAPWLQDPVTGGQIFMGANHVWRTQDSGGDPAFLDAHCNTTGLFGTSDQLFTGNCGDWQPAGPALATTPGTKAGSYVVALARGMDQHTLWVGTRIGRIYVSQNADTANPADVTYTRIDTADTPTRYPSGISVDPTNPNHAIITFSGYNAYAAAAGTAPGHVFDVVYDPGSGTATWTNIDHNLGDQPILDVAYDQTTGSIYVSTDWGVDRLAPGASSWEIAGKKLPPVAVYGLTLAKLPSGERVLYAVTHGRGAYRILLGSK
jgi:hypothetical protein